MPYKEHIKWLEEDHQRLDELAFMQALNLCDISVYQGSDIELVMMVKHYLAGMVCW